MTTRRFRGWCAAVSVIAVVGGPAAGAPLPVASPPTFATSVQRVVAAGAPGALGLDRSASASVAVARGVSSLATGRRLQPGDRYRIGSITKSFVATLVMREVQHGRVGLDDAIGAVLPGVPAPWRPVTIRQLLEMRSGIFDYTEDDALLEAALTGRSFRPRELLAAAAAHPMLFAPGRNYSYSNTNYVVLGLLLERLDGRSLGEQLSDELFEPLGLHDTWFPTSQRSIPGPHAHGYLDLRGSGLVDVTALLSPSVPWAAGAIVSTAADVTAFHRALLTGKVLPMALVRQMIEGVPTPEGFSYGFGLLTFSACGSTFVGHDGSVPGYYDFVLSTTDASRQAIVAMNVGGEKASATRALNDALASALCGGARPAHPLIGAAVAARQHALVG